MIAECRNLAMLRKSLATLPKTLDQTYERILTAISEEDRIYTIRILQWLTFSARPLTLKEVAEVAAIDVAREPAFNRDEVLVDPLEALKICSSLVTTVMNESDNYESDDDESTISELDARIVTLAHYSVQEYLISERIRRGPAKQYSMKETECHRAMTIGCLGYLNRFQQPLTHEIHQASVLAEYSAQFWSNHLQKTGDREEEMSRLAMRLLLMEEYVFANSIRFYNPERLHLYHHQVDPMEIRTPLYYASSLGLITITKLLLDQDVDVNAQSGEYGSALFAAVRGLHLSVVELLVKAKADVDFECADGAFVLHEAIAQADRAISRVLIDAGADVNKRDLSVGTAIHIALTTGDEVLVKMLIDAGADVNTRDEDDYSALQIASCTGAESVVRLLIQVDAGANAPGKQDFDMALLAAAQCGNIAVVELLLDEGADIHAQHAEWGNALLAAAQGGHTAVVELLLDRGAKIDAHNAEGNTALHSAVGSLRETTAEVLLRRGASLAPDTQSKGVMNHAIDSAGCTLSLVRMLQQYSVPLDTVDVENMTPLHYCVKYEHEAIAKQLIDAGIQIDSGVFQQTWPTKVGITGNSQVDATFAVSESAAIDLNPLHFAVSKELPRMAEFLLKHGANPNALSKYGDTPLHRALRAAIRRPHHGFYSYEDTSGIAQARDEVLNALLADPRTSLTAANEHGESSLHCVGYGTWGSAIMVQRLIDKGADPCLINSSQQSPLHLAIQAKDDKSVKTLLSMGASVSQRNEDCINVLHYAAQIKNHNVLVTLLDSEQAKAVKLITSKDKNGRNVLHHMFWAEWHEFKTIHWLLYHGASGSELDNFGVSPVAQYVKCSSWTLDVEVCRSLLRTKEAASFVGHEGQTLGHFCAKRFDFQVPILEVLHERGVDLTEKDHGGRTVLHYSVLYNTLYEEVLRYLVSVIGIKADDQDEQGRTALQYAMDKVDDNGGNPRDYRRWERIRFMLERLPENGLPLVTPPGSSHRIVYTLPPLKSTRNRVR